MGVLSPEDHFSEVWAAELGNDSTDPGCLEQGLGRFNDTINECDRMENGEQKPCWHLNNRQLLRPGPNHAH